MLKTNEELLAEKNFVSDCCGSYVSEECTDDTCYHIGYCCKECQEWCHLVEEKAKTKTN